MSNDTASRFWARVDKTDDCWLWTAYVKANGYATFYPGGGRHVAKIYVHRYSYEQHHGPIPEGMEIDHTCNVRNCVNPAHLEVVTHRENLDRAKERRTTCANGHDRQNMYMHQGHRYCRKCRSESHIRRRIRADK